MAEDPLRGLHEALGLTPDNLPLRHHLAKAYVAAGRYDEAIEVYRDGLKRAPGDTRLARGVAAAYQRAGRHAEATVVIEDLMQREDADSGLHLLLARSLFALREIGRARAQYRLAVDLDPDAADPALAEDLGLRTESADDDPDDGRVRVRGEGPDLDEVLVVEKPDIDFASVGGMETLKDEIRMKIIHPLAHPEIYAAYGKSVGGGILMYGPPGCGKTHLARATAGEVNARFLSVGISDVLDMWLGESERKLKAIFAYARSHSPCVLFFDEMDALGGRRSQSRSGGARNLVNMLLSELDGIRGGTQGVLVLAATNAPWDIDGAFRRPGRFDRVLFVPPPDAAARADVLRALLAGKPVADVDHEQVARRTDEFSGADLKGLVDRAIEAKLAEAMRKGVPSALTTKDLLTAARAARPSTKEWFATAKNYAMYSNQGGAYDDVLRYLGL